MAGPASEHTFEQGHLVWRGAGASAIYVVTVVVSPVDCGPGPV